MFLSLKKHTQQHSFLWIFYFLTRHASKRRSLTLMSIDINVHQHLKCSIKLFHHALFKPKKKNKIIIIVFMCYLSKKEILSQERISKQVALYVPLYGSAIIIYTDHIIFFTKCPIIWNCQNATIISMILEFRSFYNNAIYDHFINLFTY